MKIFLALSVPMLAASLAHAQEPSGDKSTKERQSVGEVISADTATETLTVKATGVDSKGEPIEKTMTLPVEDSAAAGLEGLKGDDKVIVLWRGDEEQKRDVVVAVKKDSSSKQQQQP